MSITFTSGGGVTGGVLGPEGSGASDPLPLPTTYEGDEIIALANSNDVSGGDGSFEIGTELKTDQRVLGIADFGGIGGSGSDPIQVQVEGATNQTNAFTFTSASGANVAIDPGLGLGWQDDGDGDIAWFKYRESDDTWIVITPDVFSAPQF